VVIDFAGYVEQTRPFDGRVEQAGDEQAGDEQAGDEQAGTR
jgi:hypothetical protein